MRAISLHRLDLVELAILDLVPLKIVGSLNRLSSERVCWILSLALLKGTLPQCSSCPSSLTVMYLTDGAPPLWESLMTLTDRPKYCLTVCSTLNSSCSRSCATSWNVYIASLWGFFRADLRTAFNSVGSYKIAGGASTSVIEILTQRLELLLLSEPLLFDTFSTSGRASKPLSDAALDARGLSVTLSSWATAWSTINPLLVVWFWTLEKRRAKVKEPLLRRCSFRSSGHRSLGKSFCTATFLLANVPNTSNTDTGASGFENKLILLLSLFLGVSLAIEERDPQEFDFDNKALLLECFLYRPRRGWINPELLLLPMSPLCRLVCVANNWSAISSNSTDFFLVLIVRFMAGIDPVDPRWDM
mmetsp:Transcript_42613/g.83573  ORF Transcript_42613/g.83573 Transcript_42613/m.83573 type:complete len:359 (+) Transcript_42613:644-1720(+)